MLHGAVHREILKERYGLIKMDGSTVVGKSVKVSGPLIIAEGMRSANMFDVVRVGKQKLIGEII